jgi:hypothetical protein
MVFGTAVGLEHYREGLRCDLWRLVLRLGIEPYLQNISRSTVVGRLCGCPLMVVMFSRRDKYFASARNRTTIPRTLYGCWSLY